MGLAPCSIDGCDRNAHCRGMCNAHYEMARQRRIKGQSADLTVRLRVGAPVQDAAARFMRYAAPLPDPGCWPWRGALNWKGYGKFWIEGRTVGAHRFAWEYRHGPIADDLTIDHLCRNKACVNPDHMELVSRAENAARRWRVAA